MVWSHDDDSGLVYLRARYMNPATGSFITTDPVQGAVGMGSVRWNPYAYAGSNPTTFTDPSGEFFPLLGLIGAGLGALFGGGFDLASQVINNIRDGRDIFACIDINSILESAIDGMITGGISGAFGLGPMGDFVVGVGYDLIRGRSFEEALVNGFIGMGTGAGIDILSSRSIRGGLAKSLGDLSKEVEHIGSNKTLSRLLNTGPARQGGISPRLQDNITQAIRAAEDKFGGDFQIMVRSRAYGASFFDRVPVLRNLQKPVGASNNVTFPIGWRWVNWNASGTPHRGMRLSDVDLFAVVHNGRNVLDGADEMSFITDIINQNHGAPVIQHGTHINGMIAGEKGANSARARDDLFVFSNQGYLSQGPGLDKAVNGFHKSGTFFDFAPESDPIRYRD